MALQYTQMLRQADQEIATYYFILAGFFSWLLLAGFLVSPSTFSSNSQLHILEKAGDLGTTVAATVRHVPLLYIAAFCCLIAVAGLGSLWWRWRQNYIWVNRCIVM